MTDFLGAPAWRNCGPNPVVDADGNSSATGAVQSVVALRISSPQPASYTLYAATINGGIWRADNFTDAMLEAPSQSLPAIQWSPLTDQEPTLSTCSLALDPLDPSGNTLWVGTGQLSSGGMGGQAVGLLRTTNGRSRAPAWAVLGGAALQVGDVSLVGQRIVSVVPTTLTDPTTRRQIILVAALDGHGILRSSDVGQTFRSVNGPAGPLAGQATDLVADPNDPNTFYASIAATFQNQNVIRPGGIFRSGDGGLNWIQIDGGIPQVTRSVSLKLAVFNNMRNTVPVAGPTVLYVGQANTTGNDNNLIGLFRSANPTHDPPLWSALFSSPNPANVPNGLTPQQWPAAAKIPWFGMAVDPGDWNNLYVGGMSWLYRVRVAVLPGGGMSTTWANWDAGGGWDHRSLNFIASNILIGTADPGIFGLANNANRWVSLNNSLSVTEFYAVAYDLTRGFVFGGAQDIGTPVQSAGGGWGPLPGGGGDGGLALVGTDGVYYYATNGGFLRDRDGSVVAPAGVPTVSGAHGAIISPSDPRQLVVAVGQRLFESQDQGDTVRNITPAGVTSNLSAFSYGTDNPSAIYVGTTAGQLFLRTNGNGAPVALVSYPGAGFQVDDIAVDHSDWRRAAVISDDGRVFFTIDAGAHWTNIRGNVGDVIRFMRKIEVVTDGRNVIVLIGGDPPAGNSGVACTLNPDTDQATANATWRSFGIGLPRADVTDLRYYPAGEFQDGRSRGDALLAGTFGRGAWIIASPSGPVLAWSGEEDLGAVLSSAPAACTWGVGRVDIFYRGQNNHLWHRWFDGNWHNEEDLGGVLSSAPAACSWGVGRVDIFYRGQNDHLWHRWFDGNWHDEEDLGGVLSEAPSACTWGPGRVDIFYRGQNNHLWHRWFDGNWHNEEDLGGVLSSAPAACTWGLGRVDIFYRGQNNHLWHRWFDGNWHNEEDLGGVLSSAPAACSWGVGRVDIFYRGQNDHLWHRWFDGNWHNEEDLGGVLNEAPSACTWGPRRIDAIYRGQNDHLWHRWYPV
jgi:hypothetical protein